VRFNPILKRMVELSEQSIMEMQGQTNCLFELRFLSNQYNLADESFSGRISVSSKALNSKENLEHRDFHIKW
jgi:hypothetical protein